MSPEEELRRAVIEAHHESDCDDYYCGCWDRWPPDRWDGEEWPKHTRRFLGALEARGYKVVKV